MLPQQLQNQLKIGREAAKKVAAVDPSKYSRIVFCGMGGSIMPAEAVSMLWLEDCNIYINRTPYLPYWAGPRDFVICISWSGNTEETISAYLEAGQKNIDTIVVTTGGKLAELAEKDKTPLILLPNSSNLNPRNGFSEMLAAILTLISQSAIIENTIVSSLFEQTDLSKMAESLASAINSKTPLIYSSYPWRFLGAFWKRFFNENSKIHSFNNFLPEAGHNEIVPIFPNKNRGSSIRSNESGRADNGCSFFYLLLKDNDENPDDTKRIEKFEKFLKNNKVPTEILEVNGINRLEKILGQYSLASLTSELLAQKLGVDPDSTEVIESFKKLS